MTQKNAKESINAEASEFNGSVELPTNPSALVGFLVLRFGMGILGWFGMVYLYLDNRQWTEKTMERMIKLEQQSINVVQQLTDELKDHRQSRP